MPPIPPPLTPHHRHHHFLKKPTSLPDAIFTALSLLVLFSTYPKSPSLCSLPTNIKLSFPLYPRKFPKMSSPSQTLESPAGGPVPAVRHAAVPTRLAQAAPRRRYIRLVGRQAGHQKRKKRRHKKTPHRIAPGAVKRRR
ncbi:hypothetical protein CASFOL_003388 [Castilleja foliolosa]|uniref:Uncharacterized protein n=1 Tax=Castilleja foliolosa TaxID=1961234 RepID=A0ABD3EIX7_9LAMI